MHWPYITPSSRTCSARPSKFCRPNSAGQYREHQSIRYMANREHRRALSTSQRLCVTENENPTTRCLHSSSLTLWCILQTDRLRSCVPHPRRKTEPHMYMLCPAMRVEPRSRSVLCLRWPGPDSRVESLAWDLSMVCIRMSSSGTSQGRHGNVYARSARFTGNVEVHTSALTGCAKP